MQTQLRRFPRLLVGLVVFGFGGGLTILGDYGLPGWDVFHQGLSEQLPISIGVAAICTGAVILVVVLLLREPIGSGTIANVLVIGLAIDATLWAIDDPSSTVVRALFTFFGPLIVGVGSGIYLGTRMGPGPRDGVMTALGRRGVPLWLGRFGVEAAALAVGLVMGGTVGWGTVWFLIVIGPTVHWAIEHLSVPLDQAELGAATH